MEYTKEMLKRINLQQLRGFITMGKIEEHDERSYSERLEQATEPLMKIFKDNSPSEEDFDNALRYALTECEYVFTEIGMKVGAKLIFEILS